MDHSYNNLDLGVRMGKICSKCGLEKDQSEFYKDRSKLDGLRYDCKACHVPVVRRYQSTDRGQEIAAKTERNRSGTITRRKSHNRANADYKKTEGGRIVNVAHSHRRRERALNLDTTFTKDDILELYIRFDNKCFICKSPENLSIDHHRPLCNGHGLSSQNAVLLCVKCNCIKGKRSPEDFYSQEQLEILNGIGII